jgi:hypothetical protein
MLWPTRLKFSKNWPSSNFELPSLLYITIYEKKICFNDISSNDGINFYSQNSNRGNVNKRLYARLVQMCLDCKKIMYARRTVVCLFHIRWTIQSDSARFNMKSNKENNYCILAARNNIHWTNIGFYDCDRKKKEKPVCVVCKDGFVRLGGQHDRTDCYFFSNEPYDRLRFHLRRIEKCVTSIFRCIIHVGGGLVHKDGFTYRRPIFRIM